VNAGAVRAIALYPAAGTTIDDTFTQTSPHTSTIILGTATLTTSRTLTIPVTDADASFVMTQGTQGIAGPKTFSSTLTVSATTNQLILGTTNTITITSPAPAASRVYTIPDVSAAASFVMTEGIQTIAGAKTFTSAITSSSVTTTQNSLGTALNIRNLYDNSQTRTYSSMTIVNGVGGSVQLTFTASATTPTGTLVRLANITGTTGLATTTDYYVYGSSGTTLFLASSYANAIAGTAITTASGTYSGGNALMTLYSSVGTGTTLNFISGIGSTPTSISGSAIDSVLSSYGASVGNPTVDLVFRTSLAGAAAAERLRLSGSGSSITGGLAISGTLSGPAGSTLTIGGGSTTVPSATMAGGSFLSFAIPTYPTFADYFPIFNASSAVSLGTKINFSSNAGAHALIGVSTSNGLAGGGIGGSPAIWFSTTGSYLGGVFPFSSYHFYNYAVGAAGDFDSGQGISKGYPFFRINSTSYTANSGTYNEVVLAVARNTARNYGTVTSVVQNGADIDITFTIATAGVIPAVFEIVVFGRGNQSPTVVPSNFVGSGRVSALTYTTTNIGDSVVVKIPGTVPTGTYVSGASLMGSNGFSSARISFEIGAVFGGASTTTFPYYPVTPALSYEIGFGAASFNNRIGWHLFSHIGVTDTIHMCSYSPTINFATLQTAASEINIGTGITASTFTKTINIGTGGANGSTTAITIGATNGTVNTIIRGNLTLGTSGGTLGFFGLAGGTRASVYTQTYSTTTKTHSNSTYAAPSGGATIDANARTSLGQLAADVTVVKNLINSVIDDLQAYGLFQ
jgi:hypothetical protein